MNVDVVAFPILLACSQEYICMRTAPMYLLGNSELSAHICILVAGFIHLHYACLVIAGCAHTYVVECAPPLVCLTCHDRTYLQWETVSGEVLEVRSFNGGAKIAITYRDGDFGSTATSAATSGAQNSCKSGSLVIPVTGMLLPGNKVLKPVEIYEDQKELFGNKSSVLIPAFSATCILFVILGGCVYGMFTARCGVLLSLPIFHEGVGRSHADSVESRSREGSHAGARKLPEASFVTVAPPKVSILQPSRTPPLGIFVLPTELCRAYLLLYGVTF